MKKLIFFILISGILINPIFSQKVTKTLSEAKFGVMECKNKMDIDVTNNDTTYFVTNYFQNEHYTTIIDRGSLFFMRKEKLEKTIKEIEMCLPYMDVKTDEFSVGDFRVSSKFKYLFISDDDKYCTMSKKHVIKWLEWLKQTKLP